MAGEQRPEDEQFDRNSVTIHDFVFGGLFVSEARKSLLHATPKL